MTYLDLFDDANDLVAIKNVGVAGIQGTLKELHAVVAMVCLALFQSDGALHVAPSMVDEYFSLGVRAIISVHDEAGDSTDAVHPLRIEVKALLVNLELHSRHRLELLAVHDHFAHTLVLRAVLHNVGEEAINNILLHMVRIAILDRMSESLDPAANKVCGTIPLLCPSLCRHQFDGARCVINDLRALGVDTEDCNLHRIFSPICDSGYPEDL